MDLTILIPTINRHEFLARTLDYYRIVGFRGHIFIGDSSDDKQAQKNKDLIATTKELNITYHTCPDPPYLHSGMCVREMNKKIPTKYAVFQGNDDFFIPSGLQQCIDFLNSSPNEYIAAHGRRCAIKIVNDKPYGKINDIAKPCFGRDWADENFSHRWQRYVRRSYCNQFSVHRTNIWKKMYEQVHLIPSRHWGAEFLPCSLNAILGKTKQLDCAYAVRQNYNVFRQAKIFDDMCMDDWALSIRRIRRILTENNIPSDIVYSYLWFHVSSRSLTQYSMQYEDKEESDKIKPNPEWFHDKDFLPIFNFLDNRDGSHNTNTYYEPSRVLS